MKKRHLDPKAQKARKRQKVDAKWQTSLGGWHSANSSLSLNIGTTKYIQLVVPRDSSKSITFYVCPKQKLGRFPMAYADKQDNAYLLVAPNPSFFHGRQYLKAILGELMVMPTVLEQLVIDYTAATDFILHCHFAQKSPNGPGVPDKFYIDEIASSDEEKESAEFMRQFGAGYNMSWIRAFQLKWR